MGLDLNNVLIGADNVDRLATFYTNVLGTPTWQDGGWVGWRAGGGFLVVGPHSDVTAAGNRPGPVLIGFQTDDVQGEFERITNAGAVAIRAPFRLRMRLHLDRLVSIGAGTSQLDLGQGRR